MVTWSISNTSDIRKQDCLTPEPHFSTIFSCPLTIHAKMGSLEITISIPEHVGILMDFKDSLSHMPEI